MKKGRLMTVSRPKTSRTTKRASPAPPRGVIGLREKGPAGTWTDCRRTSFTYNSTVLGVSALPVSTGLAMAAPGKPNKRLLPS